MDAATADIGDSHEGTRNHPGGLHTLHSKEKLTLTNLPKTLESEHKENPGEKKNPPKSSTP